MKENRVLQILKILYQENTYIESSEICNTLKITSRTLRNDIKNSREVCEKNGVVICSKPGAGYYLNIIDETLFQAYIGNEESGQLSKNNPNYPNERVEFLIRLFLNTEGYLKIEEIEERIFFSRSTLTNDLKKVRKKLDYFNLKLVHKPGYGLRIEGRELDVRACMRKYHFDQNFQDKASFEIHNDIAHKNIQKSLYKTLTEKNFHITDAGFDSLVEHIGLALERNGKHGRLDELTEEYKRLEGMYEFEVAKHLVSLIEQAFHISLAKIEVYYITIHLLGKRVLLQDENEIIPKDHRVLLEEILNEINDYFGIDFSHDEELITHLFLHFQPMIDRLKYKITVFNPMIEKLASENPVAFQIALFTSKIMEDRLKTRVNLDEVGYLTPHYALAMERMKGKLKGNNILIVCSSGYGSSQLLLYKIKHKFDAYINQIHTMRLYELEHSDIHMYDYIFSTVPIPFETKVPVIYIKDLIDDEDVDLIQHTIVDTESQMLIKNYLVDEHFFIDLEVKSREEAIALLIQKMESKVKIPADFYKLVMEREEVSATEYGNFIAVPHPLYPVTEETFIAIALLKKPIIWEMKKVKFIFLLSVEKGGNQYFNKMMSYLAELILNKEVIKNLEKTKDLNVFKKELSNLPCDTDDPWK